MEGRDCIVCDIGSGLTKVGLASDYMPSVIVPTIVGRPVVRDHLKYSRHLVSEPSTENIPEEYLVLRKPATDEKPSTSLFQSVGELYVGSDARERQSFLDLSRPVDKGIVRSWTDVEAIFEKLFSSMSLNDRVLTPSNQRPKKTSAATDSRSCISMDSKSVVITDSMSNSISGRLKIIEMMFETFSFDRFNLSPSAALTLASRGSTSGLVVDVGDTKTEIVPVVSGFVQKGSIRTSDLGGRTVTNRLMDLLKLGDSANYRLDRDRDFYMMERAKENLCYVATDLGEERYLADTTALLSQQLTLPDKTLVVNSERFMASEILFQPGFLGDFDRLGIPGLVTESIQTCAIDLRQSLFKSIVLSGGSSLIPGFTSRLRQELTTTSIGGIGIDDTPTRQFSAFIGGCVMAQTTVSDNGWWIDKKEYEERGSSACIQRLFAPPPAS